MDNKRFQKLDNVEEISIIKNEIGIEDQKLWEQVRDQRSMEAGTV